ncbi:lysozyme inhibitor LprI family protein [Cupriavidus sp. BIS7]|uniref:lysozyme inhibitor LprI family protein n=1 Tax=Cupriavidus sp. BIS7 TaxID=1217718 RepID=UPI001ED8FD94|nr:lysozyme inhibitor LprI family protein [Cupriavidus sp. BIS7]
MSNGDILSERALRAECSYEITGVRECLQEKQRASEANLKHAEKQAGASLDKWDEDPRYVKAAKARLVASRKPFIEYREAQCAFASSLGGGAIGNALEEQRLACVAELNNTRAEQLREAVSDLPVK